MNHGLAVPMLSLLCRPILGPQILFFLVPYVQSTKRFIYQKEDGLSANGEVGQINEVLNIGSLKAKNAYSKV